MVHPVNAIPKNFHSASSIKLVFATTKGASCPSGGTLGVKSCWGETQKALRLAQSDYRCKCRDEEIALPLFGQRGFIDFATNVNRRVKPPVDTRYNCTILVYCGICREEGKTYGMVRRNGLKNNIQRFRHFPTLIILPPVSSSKINWTAGVRNTYCG